MPILRKLSRDESELVEPYVRVIQAIWDDLDISPFQKVAVSIFDRWLLEDHHLLEWADYREREDRNRKLLCHWDRIFRETDVYTIRFRGRWPKKQRIVSKKYVDREGYLRRCHFDWEKFQWGIIPEYEAIYHEHWDDTNVLWYRDRKQADVVLKWAQECGLHAIEYR